MAQFLNGSLRFTSTLRTKSEGLVVWQILDKTTGADITLGVTLSWLEVNGEIIITNITGLKPSTKYQIKLLLS